MNFTPKISSRHAVIAVVLLLLGVAGVSLAALDLKAAPARMAFVSMQRLVAQSVRAQASAKRIQQYRDEKTRAIAEKQKHLEALRLEVAQLGGILNRSKLAKKKTEEEQTRAELQELQKEAQSGLQTMQREAQAELQADLSAVLGNLARERGADLVLNDDVAVMWARGGMDWTNDVVQRVNARYTR